MANLTPHFVNGRTVTQSSSLKPYSVIEPATGELLSTLYPPDDELIDQAIVHAKRAYASWQQTPIIKRASIMFKAKGLIEANIEAIAAVIQQENGKTLQDARSELIRGLEIVEFACGIATLQKGEFSDNLGSDLDSYSFRQPLGICLGLTPSNFPAMIPLWMFPIAIACGNTFILKPSEKVPSASLLLAELFTQAGLPAGVLQVLQGSKELVDVLLAHVDIQAVSFVGSTAVARQIYATAATYGKRVQALGGAKNHCVVMPDANIELAVSGINGAAFGAAGQRCMSLSVVVAVGAELAERLVAKLHETIAVIRPEVMGPIQNQDHKNAILARVEHAINNQAKLIIDGRKQADKFHLGPCVFDYVTSDMEIYKSEVFGPVLCIVRVANLDQALDLINQHAYGNGAAIYTQNGGIARKFARDVQAGMVGINVPIPVPMLSYSFGGWKQSLFGNAAMYGREGVNFYTKLKTVTSRWPELNDKKNEFLMPTNT